MEPSCLKSGYLIIMMNKNVVFMGASVLFDIH